MRGWREAPEVEWDRRQRRTQYTPDIRWAAPTTEPQHRRRPRTRIGRIIQRLLGPWWLWTMYWGALTGLALWASSCTPARADDGTIVFTAPAIQYAADHHDQLCTDLTGASVEKVDELLYMIVTGGHLSPRQAAEAAYFTALMYCPVNVPVLDAYANQSDSVVIA